LNCFFRDSYTGPTVISTGTLEVNNNVNTSPVTIETGATLQGDGGTGAVTNLGGAYDATLYKVTIQNPALQDATGNAAGDVTLGYASGQTELVLAQSAADAVQRVLQVSNSSDTFGYVSYYALGSYAGQALVDLVSGGFPIGTTPPGGTGLFVTSAGDYFPISVVQDNADPITNPDSYQDGVGGTLAVGATGLLANDVSHFGALSVGSVDGSTYSTVSTAHGTVTWNPDGSFSYTPNAGFFGTDTFSYVATDGNGNQSNSTTVTIRVLLPQISLVNVGTDPVLLSNDSVSPSSNADADHLDEVQIAVDPDSVFESLPYNLAGWKLNLDAVDAGGEVEFWSRGSSAQRSVPATRLRMSSRM
jgi:hypothetical protein